MRQDILKKQDAHKRIAIVGAGEVGSHLAKMLRDNGHDVIVIDGDAERLSRLTAIADVATVHGNPTTISVLRDANVASCDLFISVYPHSMQDINIVSAMAAKKLGAGRVIARVNDNDYLTSENGMLFKDMGIDVMFYPERIAADEVVGNLQHMMRTETMDFAHGKLQIAIFKLEDESPAMDMQVGELAARIKKEGQDEFRIIAIRRDDKTLIPGPTTKFQYHDTVYVITNRESIGTLMKYFGESSSTVRKVMIYGSGVIAEMVARSLADHIEDVKILENDKEKCLKLTEKLAGKVRVALGDARNSDFLVEEGIRNYDAFVALTDSDETNILACVAARKFGVDRTVAEVENLEYIKLAENLGVDVVINKKQITAGRIAKFTLSDKTHSVRYISGTDAEILEYTAAKGSRITTTALKEMRFPADALVGGVIRGNDAFIAVGDTLIEPYDRVVVFAKSSAVGAVDGFFR